MGRDLEAGLASSIAMKGKFEDAVSEVPQIVIGANSLLKLVG